MNAFHLEIDDKGKLIIDSAKLDSQCLKVVSDDLSRKLSKRSNCLKVWSLSENIITTIQAELSIHSLYVQLTIV